MKTNLGNIGFLAAAFVTTTLANSCIFEGVPRGTDLHIGDNLPEFTLALSDGRTAGTEDLIGDVSCIVFFNTDTSKEILETAQHLYEQYGVDPLAKDGAGAGKVKFLCISNMEGATEITDYWDEANLTMPWSAQECLNIYNMFATTYDVSRIYFADAAGVIHFIHSDNPLPPYEDLEDEIIALTE